MRTGWAAASRIVFFVFLFLAGYGLASIQYAGAISALTGSSVPVFSTGNWLDYFNGVLFGVCLITLIGMIVFMPPSVRAYLGRHASPSPEKRDRFEDTLSC